MSLADFFGHFAFALIALSYLVKEIFYLRVLSICACVAGISYNYFAPPQPLWTPIFWNGAFIAVNAVQLYVIWRERRGIEFSEEEKEIYQMIFKSFSPLEFAKLMRLAKWLSVEEGATLITERKETKFVHLIYNGEVSVSIGGKEVARLKDGAFVGEMSFITGNLPSATVKTTKPTRLVAWSKDELRELLRRNPAMESTVHAALSADLSRKLAPSASSLANSAQAR
ncbi:MAG: popeye domain-containing protein [Chloroherpetonaceae bacterium]|nr:popeye domain-containing protein [Chloroherpetonaceae bacterium]MDW8438489.1 cyclic nucleotide-binding domain-containing protein [Chloroherpetonaceae bacterium]